MRIDLVKFYNPQGYTRIRLRALLEEVMQFADEFLGYIEKKLPDALQPVADSATTTFRQLVDESSPIVDLENKTPMLKQFPDLFEALKTAALMFVNYPEYQEKPISKISKVLVSDYLRAFLYPRYYLAAALATSMLRDDAIRFYQEFRDDYAHRVLKPKIVIKNLEEFMQGAQVVYKPLQTHDWIIFKIDEGKMGMKVTRCLYQEVMQELNDPDLSYAITCHGDFEQAKVYNPAFRLTRPNTLVKGSYCDFCYHDTRVHKTPIHPPQAFWEHDLL
jgi:hypothetical protein